MTAPAPAAVAPRPSIAPGSWDAWQVALRPKTLWIATIPVLVGTGLVFAAQGAFDPWVAVIALAASVLMQVVTNLQNDVGYTVRGGETGTRIGLPRATANGWLPIPAVKRAIVAAVALAWTLSIPLVVRAGWPVVAMSLSSTWAAWAYMGGRWPIAYTPYGELTVFVFFGLVAVCGTVYVQMGTVGAPAWISAAALGLLAAAVLLVNNYRDIAHDGTTGRRTLAVALGRHASLRLYRWLLLVPFALAALQAWVLASAWFALPLVALPAAWKLARELGRLPPGEAQNGALFRTVLLEVAFGMLLVAAAIAVGWRL